MAKHNKTHGAAKPPRADLRPWQEKLRSPPLLCLLLALVTFAVYVPALRNDFVNYDDSDYVTANAHVQSGLKWENIHWAFTTGHASNWHPITWVSHMLDCQLFGQHAAMQHLVSVLFHIANTVLLLLLLHRITGAVWRSVIVAGLFALHPLHVESVAWASERKDVLSGFFGLLTLIAYTKYVSSVECGGERKSETRNPKFETNPKLEVRKGGYGLHSALFYCLALLLFALGLMSKPMLVTLPFVFLLLDYWPLQRFFNLQPATLVRVIIEKLPFLALSIASCVITFLVQRKGGAVSTTISFGARAANAAVSYVHYVLDMFWPNHLSVLYPHPGTWPILQVVASALFVIVVTVAVVFSLRKHPYLPVGWFWFVGMLVPAIGFIQVGIQCRADRYTYLPLIGLFIMLAWGAAELLARFSASESDEDLSLSSRERGTLVEMSARQQLSAPSLVFVIGLCLFSFAVCAVVTSRQISYWRNSETLFRRAVQVTQKNYLAYNNLGFYLSNRGEVAEAIENYRKSLEIKPDYEDALNNLGYAYAGQKKYPEAIAEYEKALQIRSNHPEVHNNLGNALGDMGRVDEAIAHYMITLQQKPEHADAHNNLGVALAMKGRYEEAIEHFHAAMRYKPSDASAHSNLGNAYAIQGKFDLAIPEYEEAIRLNPKDSQALNNLANSLSGQGKLDEAILRYNAALSLKPKDPEIHYNLGMAFARQGKRQEALAHYAEAVHLKPDYAEAQNQLRALGGPPPQ
jgi:tetratricopeptide (TPR) repeat protein